MDPGDNPPEDFKVDYWVDGRGGVRDAGGPPPFGLQPLSPTDSGWFMREAPRTADLALLGT
eukprot:9544123-Alexandrium_andersonii.AAC.1